ncbi:uncharacterized protein METZ01_LOCUS367398, partial [marine metagenome]
MKEQPFDAAVCGSQNRMFHLHGLQYQKGLALSYLFSFFDADPDDVSRHGCTQSAVGVFSFNVVFSDVFQGEVYPSGFMDCQYFFLVLEDSQRKTAGQTLAVIKANNVSQTFLLKFHPNTSFFSDNLKIRILPE